MPFMTFPTLQGQMLLIVDAVILLSVVVSQQFVLAASRRWWSWALFALCWSVIIVAASAQNGPVILH